MFVDLGTGGQMAVDDNAIMQAINARHAENREDIQAQGERLDAIVAAQQRTATAQESSDEKLDRVCFIVEGDGNGNPGLVRKLDSVIAQVSLIAASVKKISDMQDAVANAIKDGAKILLRYIWRYILPATIIWLATWFSSPRLRAFVHHFTVENFPEALQQQQPQPQISTTPSLVKGN